MNKKIKNTIEEIKDIVINEKYENTNLRQNVRDINSNLNIIFEIQNDIKEIKKEIIKKEIINKDNKEKIIKGANFENRHISFDKYKDTINNMIAYCQNLINDKLIQYANKNDVFKTFNEAAELQEILPEQALFGMMAKHIGSIRNMLDKVEKDIYSMTINDAEGAEYSLDVWKEKIGDNITYLLILYAMISSRIDEQAYLRGTRMASDESK